MQFNKVDVDAQYDKLIKIIKETFPQDRSEKLIKLYTDYEERIKEAPASTKIHFHNAYPGGYLDHVHNVIECALELTKLFKKMGGIIDFTKEELIFSAMHHDLGKLGTLEEPYYVIQESDWHRINRGEVYKHNDNRQYFRVNDLTIFILQQYGITVTQNEFLAMKLTDGLYDKNNEDYLKQYGAGDYPMRTNLHKICHWADYMASTIENDPVRQKATQ
jgi:hypothetical protein